MAGEKLFVDYAGDTVAVIDPATGEERRAHIFVAALGASNYTYAEARWTEGLPDWIGAHVNAFARSAACRRRWCCDNLKAGVTKPSRYEPGINRTYQDLADHYGCAVLPTRVRQAARQGQGRSGGADRAALRAGAAAQPAFFSLAELNAAIRECVADLNAKIMRQLGESRRELFERSSGRRCSRCRRSPTLCRMAACRVAPDYHVEIADHYYSVPSRLIREIVEARITAATVEMFHKGTRVASHARSQLRNRHTTIPEHMPSAHRRYAEWTPARMMREAAKIGPATVALVEAIMRAKPHPEQGFRACLGILRLAKSYGPSALEAACRRGNDIGATHLRLDRIDPASTGSTGPTRNTKPPDGHAVQHANIRGAWLLPLSERRRTMLTIPTHEPSRRARPHRHGQGARGAAATARHRGARASRSGSPCWSTARRSSARTSGSSAGCKFAGLRQNAAVEDVDMKAPRGLDKALFQSSPPAIGSTGTRTCSSSARPGSAKAGSPARSATRPAATTARCSIIACRGCSMRSALARGDGRHARLLKSLARVELLILDDWGLRHPDRRAAARPAGDPRRPARPRLDHRHQPAPGRTLARDDRQPDRRRRHPRPPRPQRPPPQPQRRQPAKNGRQTLRT